MQYYELATLTLPFGTAGKAGEGLATFTAAPEAGGQLLGAWNADIGTLNQLIILRGFDDASTLLAERQRTLTSASPFGCGAFLTEMTLESYAPFPFLPPVETGSRGPVYEIRTYGIKIGGLSHTIAAWERALPERSTFSPCVVAMYALDGPPRFTQIWPYADLAARSAARGGSVAAGVWPPKGGPDWLTTDMRSTIGLPLPQSPLS